MIKYEVVKESHAFGDEKVDVEVPQEHDVREWIYDQLFPVNEAMERIENLLRTKIDRATFEKWQTDINSTLDKNLTAVEQHIRKLPNICEQNFKKIIGRNITPQLESFAQQIERGEKYLQEVKATLAEADNFRRDCEAFKVECVERKVEFQVMKKELDEALRQIAEQSDLVKEMRDEMISICESYSREMNALRESIYEPRGIFKFLFKKTKQPTKLNSEKKEETNNVN